MRSHWLKFSDGSDVRKALRYTHATDEAKGRAVDNRMNPIGPSDKSVANENGSAALAVSHF
jgi:hypothetical protein